MVTPRRYTGAGQELITSTHDDHSHHVPGPSLEETREKVLARGKPFPRYEDMVIDELTDDEEEQFLGVVADA